jgi:hypothetical protein
VYRPGDEVPLRCQDDEDNHGTNHVWCAPDVYVRIEWAGELYTSISPAADE